jgi:hypothetical protein
MSRARAGAAWETAMVGGRGEARAERPKELVDPNACFCPATDGFGESDVLHIRFPRSVLAEIQAAVESPGCPWEDRHGYIRWAVWKGMGELRKYKRDPHSNEELCNLMIEEARATREAIKFEEWLEELQTTVDAHVRHGAAGKARDLALSAMKAAEQFRSPEQRRVLVGKMEAMWGQLIEGGAVSGVAHDFEHEHEDASAG